MKTYFADTNFYLRFILQDNLSQFNQVKIYLEKAKDGKIVICILPGMIIELEYVLKTQYDFTKTEISEVLQSLINAPLLNIIDREIWIEVLHLYYNHNLSLFDIYLAKKAQHKGARVLSFDTNLNKLIKNQH